MPPSPSSPFRTATVAAAMVAAILGALASAPRWAFAQSVGEDGQQGYVTESSQPNRGGGLVGQGMGDGDRAPDLPPIIPSSDPTEDSKEYDPLDTRPAPGQRPVIRDGDLSYPPEPRAPVDGIVAAEEPAEVRDGVDSMLIDTRPAEDFAAFENPPAGHDPLLFQIEDLPPVEDRRTRRLSLLEPYDPVGIRIGSFVLFPEAELGGSWYSNVLRSPTATADIAFDFKPTARLVSDWQRHALEFRAGATLSYFNELNSENDRGYNLEARGKLDLTKRTNLQAFVARDLSQESRSAIDANSAGERADLTLDRVGATFNHRFNRLSLQLRGTVEDYRYSDVLVGNMIQSNADRNHTNYEETVRASWEFKPTLTGFVEAGVNQRRYETVAQSDNIGRNSNGQRYRAGVSFGNTGKILRGELAVGYGIQTPEDSRLGSVEGVIVDANVAWRMSELTTLTFNAQSDISETTTADASGVISHSFGVEARHAFRRQLIGFAGTSYTMQNYVGVPIDESAWRAETGLEYYLSREAMLFGRYRHSLVESTEPDSNYSTDEIHIGMRIRR